MTQPLDLRLGKAEFLRWVEGQPGRYELVGGRVVMMTGGSRNHAKIIIELGALLLNRLDRKRWSVDRKSTRLNSSHVSESRMPSSA